MMNANVWTASPMLRRSAAHARRCLHSSAPRQGSPFFALGALSNSRETQHLAKLSRLPRVEHSPPLQLIKTSEVLPFASPPPPPVPQSTSTTSLLAETEPDLPQADLLSVGRAILAAKDAEISKLQKEFGEREALFARRESIWRMNKEIFEIEADHMSYSKKFWKRLLLVILGAAAVGVSTETIRVDYAPATALFQQKSRSVPAVEAAPATVKVPQPIVPPVVSKPEPVVQPSASSSWPSIFWAKS